jgi:solute carrier family 35 protein C2
MMYHIQPGMILSLLPLATYVEGVTITTTDKFFRNDDLLMLSYNALWILVGAFLAFLLESSEYLVVSYTSSLTLSVSGIFKVNDDLFFTDLKSDKKLKRTGICI